MLSLTYDDAVERARDLAESSERLILGVTGQPGAGKSTLAAALAEALPGSVVLGMDAFHLAHSTLIARGWVDRKGAIHTFDADGYISMLRRVRQGEPRVIWAPEFRRDVEDAIAGAVPIEPTTGVVITEGNYLLATDPPWPEVAELCDEIWYLDIPEELRMRRLTARHVFFGRSAREAWRRTNGSDGTNAGLVARTRDRATATITVG
ncbi:MAG TPA: nucleoside/nucleotide kinase family protein [Dermatophilaceae bacterium]|nr:nucleoside/nucleotide kinase family protein [Dermatophilaceae bacterium]